MLGGQGARGHDGRHRAAKAHKHGDKAPARKADLSQQLVHHKGNAGHVAGVLEDRQQDEQRHDDGQEGDDRPHAGYHAVDDQRVNHGVHVGGGERRVDGIGGGTHPRGHKIRKVAANEVERKPEHHDHDANEARDGREAPRKHAVDAGRALVLAALLRLLDAAGADGLDEREAHVGESRKAIGARLLLHLGDDVLHGIELVLLEAKRLDHQLVALDELGRGVAVGQASALGVIGDKLSNGVDAAVHGAAVGAVRPAEVDAPRALAVAGHVDGVLHQLVYALVLGGRDGHHRHAQEGLQGVHVHGAAVLSDLVHHVECDDHGNVQLHELRGEVEVALDVGSVNNVDDRIGLGVDDELAAHDLLARVGRERVDARQVCDRGLWMAAHLAVLAIHGDAREVAHVLV